tara:strand:+ start:21 stop:230 length:210 start_codon:yes stop_codon:yes gene_type:complete
MEYINAKDFYKLDNAIALAWGMNKDEEEGEGVSNLSKTELKTMIQSIVLDTMEEEDDLNEIIENITKNY